MRTAWQTFAFKPAGRTDAGQGLAEYALILAFIAVVAIAAVAFLGGRINEILSDIGSQI